MGTALKVALVRRGISHNKFADKMGKTKQWVSATVRKRSIQTDLLLEICDCLNASLHEFFPEKYFEPAPDTAPEST